MKSHVRNKSRNVQVVEFGSILVTEMIKLLSFLAVIQDKHTIAELNHHIWILCACQSL